MGSHANRPSPNKGGKLLDRSIILKFYFVAFVLVATVLPSIIPLNAFARARCDGISCAGAGECVVRNEEPVCICRGGYYPDRISGLNCILGTLDPANRLAFESRTLDAHEMQEFTHIAQALGNERHKVNYIRFKQNSPSESYAASLLDRHKHKRAGNVWIIIGSTALLAGGVALSVWAFQNIGAYAFSNTSMGIVVPAFAFTVYFYAFFGDIAGATGIVVGLIEFRENTNAIHKLQPIADRYSPTQKKAQRNVQFSRIAPIVASQRLCPGISLHFSFI